MIAFVVNPGSRTLKLACAKVVSSQNPALPGKLELTLDRAELPFPEELSEEMLPIFMQRILDVTAAWPRPDAVVGRGSQIGRVPAGTYRMTPELACHALAYQREHGGSNDFEMSLGGPLALMLGQELGVPAFMVDPQSVDEMLPEAQATGVLGVRREAKFHTLNSFVVARRAAHEIGKKFSEARVVVAHLGATTSVTAFEQGRAIDTTGTAPDGGPMGARQAGSLPKRALFELFREHGEVDILRLLKHQSGFLALVGSDDLAELEMRLNDDTTVQAAARIFVHQVSKAIGEQVGALSERPDAVALTGGIAKWNDLVDEIEDRLAWVAPIIVVPGELELEALAEGVGRVMLGLEGVREWATTGVVSHAPKPLLAEPTA